MPARAPKICFAILLKEKFWRMFKIMGAPGLWCLVLPSGAQAPELWCLFKNTTSNLFYSQGPALAIWFFLFFLSSLMCPRYFYILWEHYQHKQSRKKKNSWGTRVLVPRHQTSGVPNVPDWLCGGIPKLTNISYDGYLYHTIFPVCCCWSWSYCRALYWAPTFTLRKMFEVEK